MKDFRLVLILDQKKKNPQLFNKASTGSGRVTG